MRLLLSSLILILAFVHPAYAADNTIKVSSDAFIYSNDEMLHFNIKDYLTDNYNDLVPFSETLAHWSGRSSVSPKVLITLVVMHNSSDGNYTGVDTNTPFGVLSDKTGFAEQTEDVSTKLATAFYTETGTGLPNPAGIAIEKFLSQYNLDAGQFATVFGQLFPDISLADEPVQVQAVNPPTGLLQLPYPVGESWVHGGTHTTSGSCGPSAYPGCVPYSTFSSMDFYATYQGWGSDTSGDFVSAAHGGTIVVHSSCSLEVISPSGWSTSYYHLDNIQVTSGQTVSINTPVANYADNLQQATCQGGYSSGPHVHFSLKKNGQHRPLDGVSLSGYPVHAGRWDYDVNIDYFWLLVNGNKHPGYTTLLNPGVTSGPPGSTTLVTPNGAITDTTPTYTWNAVSDSTWYYLWVNDAGGNRIKTWYTASQAGCAAGSGTCSITPSTELNDGDAAWWVQTWNSAGSGPWSARQDFSVNVNAPGVATLHFPTGNVDTSTPDYYWDAVPDATWYRLWINDSTGNLLKRWYTAAQAGCASGIGVCTVSPGDDAHLAFGDGVWWVRTWNSVGYGPWSAGKQFTVGY